MTEILHHSLPEDMRAPRPLPGIAPLDPAAWLVVDEAYGAQMAERARLWAARRGDVFYMSETAQEAADELLGAVLAHLAADHAGFEVGQASVRRPDRAVVAIDRGDPLATLAHLVQEDFCILQKPEGSAEHILTAAALCFPANWRLHEKAGRPLVAIHDPVPEYGADIAKRVQRLFDGVQAGRPLWRFNALRYAHPDLFHPDSKPKTGYRPYLRSERQTILRLPQSRAVVFGIHTYVLKDGVGMKDGAAMKDGA